jgi:membrane protein implicated in regulation of membrane protease activity
VFVVVGLLGAALLVLSLLVDDVFEAIDGVLPDLGWLSGPTIGAFLAAFGLTGWVVEAGTDASTAVAVVAGLLGGIAFGWVTYRLARALIGMSTDATPTPTSLVGTAARVVTPVRADGVGEVLVTLAGQPAKMTATAAVDIPAGAKVVVVAVESPTKVVVETDERFWR